MFTGRISAYLLLPVLAFSAARALAATATVSPPVVTGGTLVYSAPITVAATVTSDSGTLTGTVTFAVNNTAVGTQSIASGSASITLQLPAGTANITAHYNGDNTYPAATSSTLALVISQATSSLAMSSNPAQLNQAVAIRAVPILVSPATAVAAGTVDFLNGGAAITGCTNLAVQSGSATCSTSFAQLGTFNITAKYSGDANTLPSSFVLPLTVGKVLAGTYVACTPDSPVYGMPVTVNVLLLAAAGVATPTGSVSLSMGNVTTAAVTLGSDGRASLLYSSASLGLLGAGSYQVTAAYSGDGSYQSSSSSPLTLTVAKAGTTVALASTAATPGQAATVTATVTLASGGGVAGGAIGMSIGGTPFCSNVAVQNGAATCTIASLPAGANTITASYSGDSNTLASTATLALTAAKSAPAISTAYLPASPVYGSQVTITATVTGASGQAAPTGSVTFSDISAGLGAFALGTGGQASLTATLGVGTHSIVAVYNGDTRYQTMTASAVSIVVGKAATGVTLAAGSAPVGQPVTLTAAVSVAGPLSGAAGTVNFTNGGAAIAGCTAVPVLNGSAACSTTFPQAGSYAIAAAYSGDDNTSASTGSLTLVAGKSAAGITTAFVPASPVYGGAVTITAAVVGPSGQAAPTGTVTFTEGTTGLGLLTVGTDGRASVAVSTFTAGVHSIVEIYSGDANYQPATAAALSIAVGKAATSIALTSSAVQIGQAVTLTAAVTVVSPGSGTPGGTVDFTSGGKAIAVCAGLPVQGGSAVCSTTFAQSGNFAVTANYSGDANTAASTATVTLTAGKPTPGITTTFGPATPVSGAIVTITATLTGASGQATPTGTVTFSDGTATLGGGPVAGAGQASLSSVLTAGTHSVVAAYAGDTNYQAATATAVNIAVAKAATSIALTSSAVQPGQPATLTAAVTIVGPGSGTPGGTVSFTNGGQAIAGCTGLPVQSGSAVCIATFAQGGSYAIAANYNGDANTAASTASLTLTAGKSTPGIATTFTPAAPVYGAAVAITATLTGVSGQAAPGGTVTFSDGTATLGTAAVGAAGQASIASALTAGTHSVVAAYGGDANYQAATAAAVSIVVAKAATSTALTSSTAQLSQPVTLTAAVTVAGVGGTAGGTVDFTSGGKAITGCTAVTVQNGVAACNTSFAQVGSVATAASYNGDSNTAPSSATLTLTVAKAAPGIYTASTSTAPPYGAAITVNALLLGAAGLAAPGGTVAFADGATALTTVAVGSDGRASLTLGGGSAAALAVGTHSITAAYSGDANYQTATAPALAIVVAKAATSVALSSNVAQIAQPVSLKASVSVISPGSAALGGTVDFSNGGKAIAGCTSMAVQNGAALCSTSFAQFGTYAIGATYNGDANTAAGAATIQVTVGKAAAGIYTAYAPTTPVYGASVTINALLLGATGLATPTGTVMFSDGGSPLAAVPVGADGRASLVVPATPLPPLGAGSHSVVATYSGDANYVMSTADALSLAVAKASTSTVVTASPAGALTATVTVVAPGAGAPTGSVQFYQAGTMIGTLALAPQGMALAATLAAGPQGGSVWAVYQGDSNFNGSTSMPVTLTGQVQVSIASDHNPALAAQAVTFTVKVSASSGVGTPGGSVQLLCDGAAVGTGTLAGGQAIIMATLAVGTHAITANYSGDSLYAAATGSMQQVVNKAATALTLSSSATATVYGQPFTLTAQLPSQASTGTVQFLDGSATLGSAQASSGVATLAVTYLAVGLHSIQATWPGDANSAAATSPVVSQTVSQAQTSTTLAVTGSTLTATVVVTAPGAGSPTGTVKFMDAVTNAPVATSALTGAGATTAMPATADAMVAAYSGDANFQASTSSPLTRITAVNAASYAIASFAPDEIGTLFGSNLATATVSAAGPPAASLGGTTVSIKDSAGLTNTVPLLFVSPGQLSFLMPPNTATGPATITVTNARGVATPTTISVARVAPGLFSMNSTGEGVAAAQIVRAHADGSQDNPQDVATYDAQKKQWVATPIDLGVAGDQVYLLLYGTGVRHWSAMPVCTIGSQATTPLFAGAQGTFAGLDQVNVALPQSLRGAGLVDVTLAVDDTVSNKVTLAFR